MPWPIVPLKARGGEGSVRLGAVVTGRARAPRRVEDPPPARVTGDPRRGSDSMIRMSSSGRTGGRLAVGRSGAAAGVDQRNVGSRLDGSGRGTAGLGPGGFGGPGGRFVLGGN